MDESIETERLVEHLIGGIADELAGLPLRDTTKHMLCNMVLDLPLTPAQQDDFGVYTPDHYRAIRTLLLANSELSLREAAGELDRCLGDGAALNALVRKYTPQYKNVYFETVWDTLKLP